MSRIYSVEAEKSQSEWYEAIDSETVTDGSDHDDFEDEQELNNVENNERDPVVG